MSKSSRFFGATAIAIVLPTWQQYYNKYLGSYYCTPYVLNQESFILSGLYHTIVLCHEQGVL